MTGIISLDWPALTLSLFNAALMLWLGLTVALNAERRGRAAWGTWLITASLLLGAVFFISHSALLSLDLNLVSRYCDRILVMNAGQVVEECAAGQLSEAQHPYTRGLLAAMPTINESRDELPVLDRTQWAGT